RAAVADLKAALEAEEPSETVMAKHSALVTAAQKIGEAVYAQSETADAPTDTPPAPADDEDVVDAEIVDEDEDR
ncbi:MAG: molecular chaperone DnaK, partial [Micrococcales bacterium]|nr:molecular chaperone DnaK [Micrococcales bacterium]